MAKKRVVAINQESVFNTAKFSSKNQIGGSTDSAWDDGSAFPEISMKTWKIGDRIAAIGDDNQSQNLGIVTDVNKKTITITWGNGLSAEYTPKQMQSYGYQKFLEDTECNSHNLTSAQELAQDFVMQDSNRDLNSLEPQRLMNTAQVSLNCDIPTYTTTGTCEKSQIVQNTNVVTICTQEDSTLLQLPHPAPRSPQKGNDLEVQTSEIVSPPSLKPLENCNPNLQLLKTSQDLLLAPTIQDSPQAHISEAWSVPLTSSGTMRNGLLSEAATLPAPTLEKDYCWLRSPGALSLSGKGRPPGQTKQEAELKKLGLINKGEVLNPAILCQWYEIPETWLDPSECRAATELLESNEQQQEIFSILESQRSPLTESSTSTPCVECQPPVTRANAQPETYIINQSQALGKVIDNLGFGFTVNWLDSSELITYNWERDDQQIIGLAIAPQHLIDKFLEDNHPQLCTKCLKVVDRNYTCDKCTTMQCTQQIQNVPCPSCESPLITLNNGCGVCGWTPENFLEETEPQPEAVQKPKGRQRKGCLYKYIENKKLKNGSIASYPRVIGHRNPDNPTHWRWGFNWEEKVDGEWKGRSIGSVPLGAIALIQSMQNEGVSLEEIIGFIRRAKAKTR
jgi:hypothetical protein